MCSISPSKNSDLAKAHSIQENTPIRFLYTVYRSSCNELCILEMIRPLFYAADSTSHPPDPTLQHGFRPARRLADHILDFIFKMWPTAALSCDVMELPVHLLDEHYVHAKVFVLVLAETFPPSKLPGHMIFQCCFSLRISNLARVPRTGLDTIASILPQGHGLAHNACCLGNLEQARHKGSSKANSQRRSPFFLRIVRGLYTRQGGCQALE